VARDEVDFAVAPTRPTSQDIVQEPLFRDRFELVVPEDHPLRKPGRVTWREALEHPFVSLTSDYTSRLQADLAAHSSSLILRPQHEVAFLTTALGMVKCGHGITALPASAMPMIMLSGLATVSVDSPWVDRQVSFFQRRGKSLSPAAEAFRDFLSSFTASFRTRPDPDAEQTA
jgi:DNA-binding transcriptional LysR family regulator